MVTLESPQPLMARYPNHISTTSTLKAGTVMSRPHTLRKNLRDHRPTLPLGSSNSKYLVTLGSSSHHSLNGSRWPPLPSDTSRLPLGTRRAGLLGSSRCVWNHHSQHVSSCTSPSLGRRRRMFFSWSRSWCATSWKVLISLRVGYRLTPAGCQLADRLTGCIGWVKLAFSSLTKVSATSPAPASVDVWEVRRLEELLPWPVLLVRCVSARVLSSRVDLREKHLRPQPSK
mmetsp:Transcript_37098/g.93081  ORF Transcript_37098/g.93081 Transcript_37098/m.93081 type:complete len:229 (-) Transcript_37098:1664-2350(-)